MKIRNGFVSNSSSSSFIVGYGVVSKKQRKNLEDYLEARISKFEYKIFNVGKFKDEYKNIGFIEFPINYNGIPDDALMCTVFIENNEGDGGDSPFFQECDSFGSYKSGYELAQEENFYPKNQQDVIKIFKTKKFFDKNFNCKYEIGAERNG